MSCTDFFSFVCLTCAPKHFSNSVGQMLLLSYESCSTISYFFRYAMKRDIRLFKLQVTLFYLYSFNFSMTFISAGNHFTLSSSSFFSQRAASCSFKCSASVNSEQI